MFPSEKDGIQAAPESHRKSTGNVLLCAAHSGVERVPQAVAEKGKKTEPPRQHRLPGCELTAVCPSSINTPQPAAKKYEGSRFNSLVIILFLFFLGPETLHCDPNDTQKQPRHRRTVG
jgi:hypothetical protein